MGLANAIQGSIKPPQQITWLTDTGAPENLTGATLTGMIRATSTGESRAIAGELTIVAPSDGTFLWNYAAGDVATPGLYEVQFTANYASAPSPSKTAVYTWIVEGSL